MFRSVVLSLLLAVLVLGAAAAEEISVESRIGRVTVYRDRAEVTRVGTVQLSPGEHGLLFNGLPPGVDADSLRVSGGGTAAVTIGGVEARREFHAEEQDARIRELEKRLEAGEDQVKRIDHAVNVIQRQSEFLRSIRVPALSSLTEEDLPLKPSLENWERTLDLLGTNLGELNAKQLELEREKRAVAREIGAIKGELQQVRGARDRSTIAVVVDTEVEEPGALTVELTYIVRPAGWLPLYDLRLDTEKKQVELTYSGTVTQKTGEDWSDVKLSLSTAQPQVGAAAPQLRPIYLAVHEEKPRPRPVAGVERYLRRADVAESTDFSWALGEVRDVRAGLELAAVRAAGPLVLFEVPGREDVPSDGNPHKATVTTESFVAELEHVAVPKLLPHTFLKAKLVNKGDTPLLAGKANVFVDGNFVGTGGLGSVAPTEEFEVGFGTDESVKVERTELKDLKGKSGIFNNRRTIARGYKITVANYRDEEVRLTLLDQIPMVRDEEIKVVLETAMPELAETTEQGILRWGLTLAPREEKEIRFEYRIEYPKDRELLGLD